MTYLEAMPISSAYEEAGQRFLSSEYDKAYHGSMLTKTRSSKFIVVVVAIVIILLCNTHWFTCEKSARGDSVSHKIENTRRSKDVLLFYIYAPTCWEKAHALVIWLQTNREILQKPKWLNMDGVIFKTLLPIQENTMVFFLKKKKVRLTLSTELTLKLEMNMTKKIR